MLAANVPIGMLVPSILDVCTVCLTALQIYCTLVVPALLAASKPCQGNALEAYTCFIHLSHLGHVTPNTSQLQGRRTWANIATQ